MDNQGQQPVGGGMPSTPVEPQAPSMPSEPTNPNPVPPQPAGQPGAGDGMGNGTTGANQ